MGKIDENKAAAGEGVKAVSSSASVSLVDEIGTLTYPRAVKYFGEEKAIEVMQKVAELGGHGAFEPAELSSPLFGGLAMPSPDKIAKPAKADFAKFPEAEFYYQAALEEHAALQAASSAARKAIAEYMAAVRG